MVKKKGKRYQKTISQRIIDVDIEKEQSVTINFGGFSMMLWKNYPDVVDQRTKRQSERRRAFGQCIRFGCPENAKTGFAQCEKHLELDRLKFKMKIEKVKK